MQVKAKETETTLPVTGENKEEHVRFHVFIPETA